MADTDPAGFGQARLQSPRLSAHGLTLWDLDQVFKVDGFAGAQ